MYISFLNTSKSLILDEFDIPENGNHDAKIKNKIIQDEWSRREMQILNKLGTSEPQGAKRLTSHVSGCVCMSSFGVNSDKFFLSSLHV